MRARTGAVVVLAAVTLLGCAAPVETQGTSAPAGVMGYTEESPEPTQAPAVAEVPSPGPSAPPQETAPPPLPMELPPPGDAVALGEMVTEPDGTQVTTYTSALPPADLQARYLEQMEATGWSLSEAKDPYEQSQPGGVLTTYQSTYKGVDKLLLVRVSGLATGGTPENPTILRLQVRPRPGFVPDA